VRGEPSVVPEEMEATITSDEMELIDNGKTTVFHGHVVLDRPPYKLRANKMTRFQDSEIVDVEGNVIITGVSPEGEQTEARGQFGRYNPATDTADLWTRPQEKVMVKWEDAGGQGQFFSEKARVYISQKRARLMNAVTGHIIPAPR
jgi:lipopolysaccharide export system protein LptA